MDWLQFATSFVGAGAGTAIVSSVIDWIKASRVQNKEHRIRFLREQVANLYGPVYHWVRQNEVLFGIEGQMAEAYKVEYIEKEYSDEPLTQKNLRNATEKTISIRNSYVETVERNNDRVATVIEQGFPYVDPEDVIRLAEFFADYWRRKLEWDDAGKLQTPVEIYSHLGEVSFMKPSFMKFARERFEAKAREIRSLSGAK